MPSFQAQAQPLASGPAPSPGSETGRIPWYWAGTTANTTASLCLPLFVCIILEDGNTQMTLSKHRSCSDATEFHSNFFPFFS